MASTLLANKFAPEGLTYDDVLLVPAEILAQNIKS
jgi:IMP dehydrogenase/GMP reductase